MSTAVLAVHVSASFDKHQLNVTYFSMQGGQAESQIVEASARKKSQRYIDNVLDFKLSKIFSDPAIQGDLG